MNLATRTLSIQRLVLVGMAATVPAASLWNTIDPNGVPKITLVLLGATIVTVVGAVRVQNQRVIEAPNSPVVYAVMAFIIGIAISFAASPAKAPSLFGPYQRFTGAISYAAYAVIMLSVIRTFRRDSVKPLAGAILVASGIVAALGLAQWAGFDIRTAYGDYADRVVSTIGNPSGLSGFLAIAIPLTVYFGASRRSPMYLRALAGSVGVAAVAVMVPARAVQGPAAAIGGLTVLILAWLLERPAQYRRRALTVFVVAVAVIVVVAVLGFFGSGPLQSLRQEANVAGRLRYWDSAVSMFRARPLTGVGIGLFGQFFYQHRSQDLAASLPHILADSPHNVPLEMFATGGVVVGFPYLLIIASIAWHLGHGFYRLQGPPRVLLGAVGGAWAASQAQALVSIDTPALALMQWLLGGAVVAASGTAEWRPVSLPWSRSVGQRGKKGSSRAHRRRERVVVWCGGAAALLLAWPATIPLRADLSGAAAIRSYNAGQPESALASARRASEIAPWNRRYAANLDFLFVQLSRPENALSSIEEALALDPYWREGYERAAELAIAVDAHEVAWDHLLSALAVDPRNASLRVRVAERARDLGREADAMRLVQEALRLVPDLKPAILLEAELADAGVTS